MREATPLEPARPEEVGVEERLAGILRAIAEDDAQAVHALQSILTPGLRLHLRRRGFQAIEDMADRILDQVTEAIRSGEVQTPSAVLSRVRSLAGGEPAAMEQGSHPAKSRIRAMRTALSELSCTDRDAVSRFMAGESAETICACQNISAEHFAGIRSRLKARYLELCETRQPQGIGNLARRLRAHTA